MQMFHCIWIHSYGAQQRIWDDRLGDYKIIVVAETKGLAGVF